LRADRLPSRVAVICLTLSCLALFWPVLFWPVVLWPTLFCLVLA
jgi:hypothetical protein